MSLSRNLVNVCRSAGSADYCHRSHNAADASELIESSMETGSGIWNARNHVIRASWIFRSPAIWGHTFGKCKWRKWISELVPPAPRSPRGRINICRRIELPPERGGPNVIDSACTVHRQAFLCLSLGKNAKFTTNSIFPSDTS